MEYQLVGLKLISLPTTIIVEEQEVYGVSIVVFTGIVGQTYTGFQNSDEAFCPLDKTKSIDENELATQVFATAFVAQKYPNTI